MFPKDPEMESTASTIYFLELCCSCFTHTLFFLSNFTAYSILKNTQKINRIFLRLIFWAFRSIKF